MSLFGEIRVTSQCADFSGQFTQSYLGRSPIRPRSQDPRAPSDLKSKWPKALTIPQGVHVWSIVQFSAAKCQTRSLFRVKATRLAGFRGLSWQWRQHPSDLCKLFANNIGTDPLPLSYDQTSLCLVLFQCRKKNLNVNLSMFEVWFPCHWHVFFLQCCHHSKRKFQSHLYSYVCEAVSLPTERDHSDI